MRIRPLLAFAGTAALASLAFAPLVQVADTAASVGDGKAQALAAGELVGAPDGITAGITIDAEDYLGVECTDGFAGVFPCDNVVLEAFAPIGTIGAGQGTDSWGWTAPDGTEYAFVGSGGGVGVFALTETVPTYMGLVPTNMGYGYGSVWRDMKVVEDHLYITSEVGELTADSHGIQVVDLIALHEFGPTGVIVPDNTIAGYGGHNLVQFDFEEDRGVLGVVYGQNILADITMGYEHPCGDGITFFDVKANPIDPPVLGCYGGGQDAATATDLGFGAPGGTHDAQCVEYHGPDNDHNGLGADGVADTEDDEAPADICLLFNEGRGVFIVDVSPITRDKLGADVARGTPLAQVRYPDLSYSHQGWFTEDHRWVLHNDETDESGALGSGANVNTATYWFDATDLDLGNVGADCDPDEDEPGSIACPVKEWNNPLIESIDHNMYVVGNRLYQANYGAGLRVLEFSDESLSGPQESGFTEVAFLDVHPGSDLAEFHGAWNVYPYLESGNLIVSDFDKGMFVIKVADEIQDDPAA